MERKNDEITIAKWRVQMVMFLAKDTLPFLESHAEKEAVVQSLNSLAKSFGDVTNVEDLLDRDIRKHLNDQNINPLSRIQMLELAQQWEILKCKFQEKSLAFRQFLITLDAKYLTEAIRINPELKNHPTVSSIIDMCKETISAINGKSRNPDIHIRLDNWRYWFFEKLIKLEKMDSKPQHLSIPNLKRLKRLCEQIINATSRWKIPREKGGRYKKRALPSSIGTEYKNLCSELVTFMKKNYKHHIKEKNVHGKTSYLLKFDDKRFVEAMKRFRTSRNDLPYQTINQLFKLPIKETNTVRKVVICVLGFKYSKAPDVIRKSLSRKTR